MKKFVNNLLAITMTFTVAAGNAEIKKTENIDAILESIEPEKKLLVRNEKGQIVFTATLNKGKLIGDLPQLKVLAKGKYTMEFDKDFEFDVIPFTVEADGNVKVEKRVTNYKPVIRSMRNYLMVSKLNFNGTPIEVEIKFKNANTNYRYKTLNTEVFKDKDMLKRAYKLDTTKKGDYKIIVKTDNRTYVENFKF